ncbi:MAG: tetratricopeptide repeat protein [Proteobacteria bacterium]|nr:tetratricopeptide repeat protein [Pseudomonadota bacterium]
MIRLAAVISVAAVPIVFSASAQQRDEQAEYQACLTLTKREPEMAFESALAWKGEGGGYPARHCEALALVALKKYHIAAPRLEELAEDMANDGSPLAIAILSQAANVWLLEGDASRGYFVASAGLDIDPDNVDLLIDRSRMSAKLEDYQAARTDLDRALQVDPSRTDAMTFRAAAWRQLGNNERALEDVELALSLTPDLPDALIERGILYRQTGRKDLARKDWMKVLDLSPYSVAGDTARINLENLDVNKDK